MADQSTGYTPTPFDLAGGSQWLDYLNAINQQLQAARNWQLQQGQLGGYTPAVEPLGPTGEARDWYGEVIAATDAYKRANPNYKRDPNNPSLMDPDLFAQIAQGATGAGNPDIWKQVRGLMTTGMGSTSPEQFAQKFNAVVGNAFTAATPSLAKQQMDQAAAQWDQQFGEQQRQFDIGAGQSYMNLLASLSGPSNYFQYANALRGAEGSPQLAFAQKLATGGLPAFQWGQSPGAMTPQSLVGLPTGTGTAPAGGGFPGPTTGTGPMATGQPVASSPFAPTAPAGGGFPGPTTGTGPMATGQPVGGSFAPTRFDLPVPSAEPSFSVSSTGSTSSNPYASQEMPQIAPPQTWHALSVGAMTPTERGLTESALKASGYNPADAWFTYEQAKPKGQASSTTRYYT